MKLGHNIQVSWHVSPVYMPVECGSSILYTTEWCLGWAGYSLTMAEYGGGTDWGSGGPRLQRRLSSARMSSKKALSTQHYIATVVAWGPRHLSRLSQPKINPKIELGLATPLLDQMVASLDIIDKLESI